MDLWQTLLVAVGGNGAILLAVAFLGRSIVSTVLTKDIEEFKAALQVAAIEHEIRFTKLHEKRAEVLADLYKLLVAATWETESFASPIEFKGEMDKTQKYEKALVAIADYFRFFDQHRIYMPEELCVSLEAFAQKLRTPTIRFGVYLSLHDTDRSAVDQKFDAWMSAWDSVKTDIPKLRRGLETEFRKLLGATTVLTS